MINWIYVLLTIYLIFLNVNSVEYGYFNTRFNHIKTCQGPKRRDCAINTIELFDDNNVVFDMKIMENIVPEKAKIIASFKGKQMVRLPVNKPCDHFFIKPIMMTIFNVTNSCLILKGRYNFSLDMAEIFMKYYNGMFMYGNWTFRTMLWTKDCNFVCMQNDIILFPKKESKRE